MVIGLAFVNYAITITANGRFDVVKRIAVDGSGCKPIGTGRNAVTLAYAFGSEMIAFETGSDFACAILANAGRGIVCLVTVHALRAAMVIQVDTGVVKQAFVVGARTGNAMSILTKFIGLALRVTFAAV